MEVLYTFLMPFHGDLASKHTFTGRPGLESLPIYSSGSTDMACYVTSDSYISIGHQLQSIPKIDKVVY